MKTKSKKLTTGISLVDRNWNGFYRGGSYLIIGSKKTGKTTLGLRFAQAAVQEGETVLFFTAMKPKDLNILADSMGFDLQPPMDNNSLIIVKVVAPSDTLESPGVDKALFEYYSDIIELIHAQNPDRIVFDDFTPYLGFENLENLKYTFQKLVDEITEQDITTVFVLSEPASDWTQQVIDVVAESCTGSILLQKTGSRNSKKGVATITPIIGHSEGQFVSDYEMLAGEGIVFIDLEPEELEPVTPVPAVQEKPKKQATVKKEAPRVSAETLRSNGFSALSSVELTNDAVTFSNLYDLTDFTLLLNNQIALFRSTGALFSLIAFKIETEAAKNGILTLSQLKNSVRLSTEKKDKMCVIKDTVIVLSTNSDSKFITMLSSKIKDNLPQSSTLTPEEIMEVIYYRQYRITDSIESASSLLDELIS